MPVPNPLFLITAKDFRLSNPVASLVDALAAGTMALLRRPCSWFSSMIVSEIVLLLLLIANQGLAFQTSLLNPLQRQRQTAKGFLSGHGRVATFTPRQTQLKLVETEGFDVASSWTLDFPSMGIADSNGLGIGNLILGLGFLAAVGAYVFANVVYTPEILEGARDLRIAERESEIRKILQAVEKHEGELAELKVPLETALGKSLEDYVRSVLEDDTETSTADFVPTAADRELATILKRTILA